MTRCGWTSEDSLMIEYHDKEWGFPVHDDRLLFEYMILDAFQAGLSWRTVLHKRENFRKAFDNFDPKKIAKYGKKDYERLVNDEGIIRNKAKINSAIINAERFLEVAKEFGSFDKYIWQFTGGETKVNKFRELSEIPAKSVGSDEMSRALIKRGFKFVGSTICYAFMQASGMVNDHLVDCFRHKGVLKSIAF